MLGLGFTGYYIALLLFPLLSVGLILMSLYWLSFAFGNHPQKDKYIVLILTSLALSLIMGYRFYEAYTYRW